MKNEFDWVLEIDDLEAAALQHAVFDRGAVVERNQPPAATAHLARDLLGGGPHRLLGLAFAPLAIFEPTLLRPKLAALSRLPPREQAGRRAIERMDVFLVGLARAVNDRLVVSGQEPRGLARRRDADRAEILLEEFACFLGVLRGQRRGDRAGLVQPAEHRPSACIAATAQDRPAALHESAERDEMIVLGPAVELGPVNRLELAVADLDGRRGRGQSEAASLAATAARPALR